MATDLTFGGTFVRNLTSLDRLSSETSLASSGKGYDAFIQDFVGDGRVTPITPLLLVVGDNVPGDTSTTVTLTVDGDPVVSTIDTVGDLDYFAVHLEAGQTYEIGMYQQIGGPSLVPLPDAFFTLIGPDGQPILTADGGGPNTPSGLDALLTFEAETSGTYYIAAQAFDQDGTNGTTGDGLGDYSVFVNSVDPNDANVYRPFYDVDTPMHSIDWGTQIDRTLRNPDGDSGTRTDNGVADGGTPIVNGDIVGKNVIYYYFGHTGDIFISDDPTQVGTTETIAARDMLDWEKQAFRNAFDVYESVADVVYIEVDNRAQADFKIILYQGTPGAGASLLGRMSPPGENNEGQMEINAGDVRWTEEGVAPGGFYFPTLLHELGHGHGMAHPHDNGGHSSVMPGADGGTGGIGGGLGVYDLSQQVFTVMSYNDGWATSPYGQASSGDLTGLNADPYGWVATLSPLDIAVIQDKYGVNEDTNTGDNVYVLKDVNAVGTYYSAIWDQGGVDEIRYAGAANAVIDLRAATLRYEEGGGGRVSYAYGIFGGFTIANGVTIENATGGSGDDVLTGNDAANHLTGGKGADLMTGGKGDDVYSVTDSGDQVVELANEGFDTIRTNRNGLVLAANVEALILVGSGAINGSGNALNNVLTGNAGANTLDGGAGDDRIDGGLGADILIGGRGDDVFIVDNAGDTAVEQANQGYDTVMASVSFSLAGQHLEALTLTGSANINATGNGLANDLIGNTGNNVLDGGEGADRMAGGRGDDSYYVDNAGDVIVELANRGVDSVFSTISYSLAGQQLENLTLLGRRDIDATGNGSDNVITGNAGVNRITGGGGRDMLSGGGGADTFVFSALSDSRTSAADRIVDMTRSDRIDLSGIDADTGTTGDQGFHLVSAFGRHAGELVLDYDTGANLTTLRVDVNGDGRADMAIEINGHVTSTSGWLL